MLQKCCHNGHVCIAGFACARPLGWCNMAGVLIACIQPAGLGLPLVIMRTIPWGHQAQRTDYVFELLQVLPVASVCPPPPCRRPRNPYAGPYSQGAATGEGEHSELSLKAMQVPAQTAAAWGGDGPDYARKWPECTGRCINGVCALLWNSPRCCYVSRRHHHYDDFNDGNDGPSAYPYKNKPEPEEEGDDAIGDGKLMGYWLDKDFYCTE